MKLNICYDNNGYIGNYTNINIKETGLDINHIVNNSCEEILISDSLDYVTYENVEKILYQIIQKLRINGKLIITGNDVRCISRLLNNDTISIEQFCAIINNIRSMSTEFRIKNLLISAGLTIESSLINHHKYEIIAMRK